MLREAEHCNADIGGGFAEASDGWQKEEPTEKGLYVHYAKDDEIYTLLTVGGEEEPRPDSDMYLKVEYPNE